MSQHLSLLAGTGGLVRSALRAGTITSFCLSFLSFSIFRGFHLSAPALLTPASFSPTSRELTSSAFPVFPRPASVGVGRLTVRWRSG